MKLKFVSLKWKLSLSFVLMALGFVALYVALAKQTFESDKISYIFETQQLQVSSLAATASAQIERVSFDARSIVSGFDPAQRKFATGTQPIFWEHPQILALLVTFGPGPDDSVTIEKAPGLAQQAQAKVDSDDKPTLVSLGNDRFAIDLKGPVKEGSAEKPVRLTVVFELKNLIGEGSVGQSIAFASSQNVISLSQNTQLQTSAVEQFLNSQSLANQDTTMVADVNHQPHLVSVAQVGFGGFRFLSFIEKEQALGALGVLFRRSVVFIAFSFFASIILSLLISNRLTQNINSLTRSTEKISKGDFSAKPDFSSNDEIGILSNSFFKMADEIQRLLLHMVDKVRMETELNTARLVQDSLFPAAASYKNGKVRLCGMYKTTSECGGDWWYYYQKGTKLYVLVADATGHGIPAALITAAARSLFAHIKNQDMDIRQIAASWDQSVFECSNGKVYMTAYLLEVDVELGECVAINSCHEPPVKIVRKDGHYKSAYLPTQLNHSLGERKAQWLTDRFQLQPGDRLVIFTDGLLAIHSPDGKTYSEKRFLGLLDKFMAGDPRPDALVKIVDDEFTRLQGSAQLPDDVTLVVLDYDA